MKSLVLFLLIIPVAAMAQVSDDFSDGDFTEDPSWTGDTAAYEVNQAGQLHLASQGTDTSFLVTAAGSFPETEWRFWMKLSFNTSANNFARVYLFSDAADLRSPLNGYYLQAGGSGDSLYIIRQSGSGAEKMYRFSGYRTFHSTNTMRFRITLDAAGTWTVMMDTTGGSNFSVDGTFHDPVTVSPGWFGVYCRYTSSNASKCYFDDLYAGPVIRDTLAPAVARIRVNTDGTMRVLFTEPADPVTSLVPSNYRMRAANTEPDSVRADPSGPAVSLYFHDPLPDGYCDTLVVGAIRDLSGNAMNDTLVRVCRYRPRARDVVIDEIMADPAPVAGLPEAEYAELHNRTAFPVDLEGWRFTVGGTTRFFTSAGIPPGGFLVITKDTLYKAYGECALLFTSSTSLPNEGSTLVLRDAAGLIIHSVTYSPSWFEGSFKEDGGWSLEMIDPANPCGCAGNWKPSLSMAGGTPGTVNSVAASNPDTEPPVAIQAVIADSLAVEITFSEAMDSLTMTDAGDWYATSGEQTVRPLASVPQPPGFTVARLLFAEPFDPEGEFLLHLPASLRDCAGNRCDTVQPVRFAFPGQAGSGDLVINEILANPLSGGSRFVEIYNRSDKVIDLQELLLAGSDTSGSGLAGAGRLCEHGYLVFPGDYAVLTPDPDDLFRRYRCTAPYTLLAMPGFPSLDDDSGTVVLARRDNETVIDRVRYDPTMHFALLTATDGVSLERSNPDLPSGSRDNWHSAAETAGFATPGYLNSHAVRANDDGGVVSAEPALFSPDNDGKDDLLTVTVHGTGPDCSVSIDIYDSFGRTVRGLANNVTAGNEGVFTWDGVTGSGTKAAIGFYILVTEITCGDGSVKRYKNTVVVGAKLNY